MPSFTYQALSEIEAINIVLSTISEAPISTLDLSGDLNVTVARQMLYDTSREVQSEGWYFNTEEDYLLVRNNDSKIPVPNNCLFLDTSDLNNSDLDVTLRGSLLYDRTNHTYVFAYDIYADMYLFLTWDELPQVARQYITIKTARKFQRRMMGDDVREKFTQSEEITARATLEDFDSGARDYNMADNYDVFRIVYRR